MTLAQTRCLYGVAGWAYEDWQGIVYPQPRPRAFDPIAYLARFFDVLEIDSSFYRIPDPKSTERWARVAAPFREFEFTMKLYQGFTHSVQSVPWNEAEAGAFEEAAERLREAGKLGCVLMQFPWSFRAEMESRDRLLRLLDRFGMFPLAVEVRHASWLADEWLFDTLRERAAAFCNIDQPRLRQCIELTDRATAEHAYLRVHGRNAKNWFRESASGAERYDYLYSLEEIRQLAEAVEALKRKAKRVRVITNNHWRGQAAASALQLKAAVEGGPVEAPATLIKHLGDLGPGVVAEKSEGGEQLEMF
ncbi:MAG: DUF72 domain-containing protein [Candidatus Sumerlaeota bacterium]|nr:DUF72 domain-containing protein [Candidatus Sumerlaeota bacterium]